MNDAMAQNALTLKIEKNFGQIKKDWERQYENTQEKTHKIIL